MNALLVARRDLASYLQGYYAYVIIAVLLGINGIAFYALGLGSDSAQYSHDVLEQFFYFCWGCAVATAILLTMRSLADEHALGTEVLLRTSILSDAEIVIGKWLAAMGIVTLYTALTVHLPMLVFVNGKISVGHMVVGYLGVLLGGAVASALGVLCSALFRNQLAAGVVAGVIAIYFAIFSWMIADLTDPPLGDILAYTALFNRHFVPFMEGRLTLSSTMYQVSLSGLFLLLATHILHSRRWE